MELRDIPKPIYSAEAMDWEHMRAHYVRALRAARERGLTQEQVAAAGGLKRQNYISKIKSAGRLGPAVELFIRAIEGLGMHPSDFFAELEGRPPVERPMTTAAPPPASVRQTSFIVNTVIETLQRGVAAPVRSPRPRRRKKRG